MILGSYVFLLFFTIIGLAYFIYFFNLVMDKLFIYFIFFKKSTSFYIYLLKKCFEIILTISTSPQILEF